MGSNTLLNRHQLAFLRELRQCTHGLPQDRWPRPVTLRRWMRRPRFATAIKAVHEMLVLELDLMLTAAGAAAARQMQGMLNGQSLVNPEMAGLRLMELTKVVRAEHIRQREKRLGHPGQPATERDPASAAAELERRLEEAMKSPEGEDTSGRAGREHAQFGPPPDAPQSAFPDARHGSAR